VNRVEGEGEILCYIRLISHVNLLNQFFV
jgi:hypothetical protein